MTTLKYIVMGIYIIVCIALIVIATIQTKDANGASGTITGSTTNNFFEKNKGRTKEGKMKKTTIVLGITLFVLTIGLGILYNM